MTDVKTATAALARLAGAFEGTLAVAARDETTGETVALEAEREMPTASVIKLAVLAAVFERARAGELSLDDRLAIRDEERVGGSGVIKELSAGTELTIRDLATLMVVVSDNMATNLLIDAAGDVEAVNRFVHDGLGLSAITLNRKLMLVPGSRGPLALAAPRDLVALLGGLLAGRIVSPEASREMLGMLARQQYLDQVPRLFDRDELADEEGSAGRIRVACKTGMIDGVRADAGVVWLDGRPLSYAVMSECADDGGRDLDADPQLVNAEAGRILVRHLWPAGAGAPPLAPHPAPRWSRLHAAAAPDGDDGSSA
jgi:beta-lactamase class A